LTYKLMIPGPVMLEDDVLFQMGQQVQPHYGPQWTAIFNETIDLLKQVFETTGDVHILVGSGTAGVDASIASLTAPGETIVVGANGHFGHRLVEIGRFYGLNVIVVEAPLGKPLKAADFDATLTQYANAAAVAVVHLETSTTVLNPVEDIARASSRHGVPVIVDAVSSLGGVPLSMDEWGIDLCASASQKCLGAPAGLAQVAVSKRAWDIMASKPERNHGWYLNLEVWQEHARKWSDWHPYPITMPTNTVLALRTSLQGLLAEGVTNRIQHYSRLASRLRNGLRELGLRLFASEDCLAPVLTGVISPDGVPSSEIVNYLLNEHGIKISGGFGDEMKERIFRVGHMGPTLTESDIDDVLNGVEAFLKSS
jgi:alanine-glyoxylate transaminase/serine-glyoxylate transaminase/serine-pyruvate transaminase